MVEEPNNSNNGEIQTNSTAPVAKEKFVTRPLRTYEEDVANFVKRGQISTSKIIAAEQKRQYETEQIRGADETKKKISLIIIVSLCLFILAGLILWGAFYLLKNDGDFTSNIPKNFRDVLIDKKQEIEIVADYKLGSEVKKEIVGNIENPPTDLNNSEIAEIVINKTVPITKGDKTIEVKEKINIQELFKYLEFYPDDTMMRSLGENYLLGLIKTEGDTVPFILIKTLEYERVFSGMLNWEIKLYREINDIFFKTLGTNDFLTLTPNNTGVAYFDPNKFTDIVIYNKDVRAIINSQNQILFFYTFVNNDHLLITSKPAVVQEIATKLNLQNIVR